MPNQVGISRFNPPETKYKECPECEGEGKKYYCSRCGWEIGKQDVLDDKIALCRVCGGWVRYCVNDCKPCSGTGQIEDESDEFDRADDIREERESRKHFKN